MNCPKCGSNQTKVINSRPRDDTVWRRRECLKCGHVYTTFEITGVQKAKFEIMEIQLKDIARRSKQ